MSGDLGNYPKWYVWNRQAGPPTMSHASEDSAIREADRLAEANPGQTFLVLACIGYSIKEPPRLFRRVDEIPF
jgi:hypothetical protein